ncbi:sugar kinase [Flexivirga endophytica]|uniref:Sugar kinase n=1 Tax=Flexivirga endophytica TaxID=1849103 RepID=A0A916WQD0_9MICO|nr:1-phosphofructokinase family hexose kinase [Flexivirga endophytica]GGB19739.1 sugar kinase [Flexivirga endophytica]GHB35979.1 sugar kinase [Flexivirga endophytica]
MILAVCLNPALDVTYDVPGLEVGAAQRVRRVTRRAGGKGVNVASVLHAQGTQVIVTGPIGGSIGRELVTDLDDRGIAHDLLRIGGSTRQTVTVFSDDSATVLNEPGPLLTEAEWSAFTDRFADLAQRADLVTISGSLPGGVPAGAYAELIGIAHRQDTVVILDCEGEALVEALHAAPDIVKINEHEAASTAEIETDSVEGVFAAAEELHVQGAAEVVITRGASGVVARTHDGRFVGTTMRTVSGNPTGAGDAFTAGLAATTGAASPWRERLRRASAWAAGAVATSVAGEIDATVARDPESSSIVEEYEAS